MFLPRRCFDGLPWYLINLSPVIERAIHVCLP
jgi:hypothetical protein